LAVTFFGCFLCRKKPGLNLAQSDKVFRLVYENGTAPIDTEMQNRRTA
jgi:hypothetical protein